MDFRDTPEQAAFRETVRSFVRDELPAEMRGRDGEWGLFNAGGMMRGARDAYRAWTKKLASRGWIAPAWPKEYGGAGMSVMEQFIFNQEMARLRAPRAGGIGTGWAGPTIIVYGTGEQKKEHLPGILSGDDVWCQGFSEPGAGSDLAALQTRAVKDGDDYVINGQKIWTSGAHLAHKMILIARTDPDAPKHKGISYFLLNMKTPGIDVRPLPNMLGGHEFNEVFFDSVRVPKKDLLGEENRGWYQATTTLDFERSNIATSVTQKLIVEDLLAFVAAERERFTRRAALPPVRHALADRYIEASVSELMSYRVVSMQNQGLIPNHEASVAKLYSSELDQRIASTGMRVLGLFGQVGAGDWSPLRGRIERMYQHATTSTIGGGTSEVQRNIIAMRGLGLPRG